MIIYEKHPVSAERKALLRQAGYIIMDAAFAPAGYVHPEAAAKAERDAEDARIADEQLAEQERQAEADRQRFALEQAEAARLAAEQAANTVADAKPKANADELDAMDAEQLHALAKERGVKVHANAGADKVREALRQAA